MGKFEYQTEYQRTHYDRFTLILPKGMLAIVKRIASEQGKSTSAVIVDALLSVYDRYFRSDR